MMTLWMIHCVLFSFLFFKLCDFDHKRLVSNWNYYFPSRKKAQSLFNELISFRVNSKEVELPEYKFYTFIIEDLIKSSIRYGTSIYSNLNEIKTALSKDISFERKINSSIIAGLYQMVLVAVIGYVFLYITELQLKITLNRISILIVFIFQSIGIAIFLIFSFKLKKFHFHEIEKYICFLYKLRSAVSSNQPMSKNIEGKSFKELCDKKNLKPFKRRVLSILRQIKSHGTLNIKDFEITINELWQSNEFKFEEFLKHLAALKLCILILFFMGSFLYILMLITAYIGI